MEKAESYTHIVVSCTYSIYIYIIHGPYHVCTHLMVHDGSHGFSQPFNLSLSHSGDASGTFRPQTAAPAAATRSLSAAVETVVVWTAGSNGDTQVVLNLVLNHPIRIRHTKLYAGII
jgi:hypothetical protein